MGINGAYAVHASLPCTTAWVNTAMFYNMAPSEKYEKIKVIGVTCLKGKVPAFEVITLEGYVFSDIPPHMLIWKEPEVCDGTALPLNSLVYNNCMSEEFSLCALNELKARKAFAYFRNEKVYMPARYWFSLDFYKENNWFHCILLENAQIAFLPSHKLVFPPGGILPDGHVFPAYQKLRKEFSV